jgi:hypothetical protein
MTVLPFGFNVSLKKFEIESFESVDEMIAILGSQEN